MVNKIFSFLKGGSSKNSKSVKNETDKYKTAFVLEATGMEFNVKVMHSDTYLENAKKLPEKIKRLENAIAKKANILIKYNAGSQPGTVREITPIKIDDHHLDAYCVASKTDKSFNIVKIEFDELEKAERYSVTLNEITEAEEKAFTDTLNTYKQEWEQYGWHVIHGKYYIDLFRKYKNGKINKTPSVTLDFNEGVSFHRWSVCGVHDEYGYRGYKLVKSAIKTFVEYSKTVPPDYSKKKNEYVHFSRYE